MSVTPALLALLGFTQFEHRSFAAFFSLGREQGPGYEMTDDLRRAECAVADADDEPAIARLVSSGLTERAVVLGARPIAGAALQLPRPINLLLVMRALDTIVGARPRTSTRLASSADDPPPRKPPAFAPASVLPPQPPARHHVDGGGESQVQRVLDELAFRTTTFPSNMDARAMAAEAAQSARRAGAPLARADAAMNRASSKVLPMEHILVIDHDAATLRLVAIQLQRFGFQMHLAGHPDDALRLMTTRFHDYIFMDPALPGLDALMICRLAKQIPPPLERAATTVVLLADPQASSTPLERALPAADACLKKPLEQQALLRLMGEREVARVAYADTARITTLI